MTFNATIDAGMFYRASLAASKDLTRPQIAGVKLERHPSGEGVLLIATDGNLMAVFYDRNGTIDGECVVEIPKHVLAACKAGQGPLKIENGESEVYGKRGELFSAKGVVSEWTFPDWRRVVPQPSTEAGQPGMFDAALLARMGSILNTGKLCALALHADSAADPHLAFGSDDNAFGVVMPLRESARPRKGHSFTL